MMIDPSCPIWGVTSRKMPTSSIWGVVVKVSCPPMALFWVVLVETQDTSLVVSLMTAFWLLSAVIFGLESMLTLPCSFMASNTKLPPSAEILKTLLPAVVAIVLDGMTACAIDSLADLLMMAFQSIPIE